MVAVVDGTFHSHTRRTIHACPTEMQTNRIDGEGGRRLRRRDRRWLEVVQGDSRPWNVRIISMLAAPQDGPVGFAAHRVQDRLPALSIDHLVNGRLVKKLEILW